jgi:2-polyprenyl-3-methyl-5-hydroxy-6-metoxy-1,4-benzoquinol methylase
MFTSPRDPSAGNPRSDRVAREVAAAWPEVAVCALCNQALRPHASIPANYLDEVFYTSELRSRVAELRYGRCRQCGAIWATDARRDEGVLAQIYAELPAQYWANLSGHQPTFEHWDGLLQRFARGLVLCDVGCGDGKFLEGISKRWEKHGLDPNREAAAHCRRRGLDVAVGTPLTTKAPGTYDVITCIDTIEHMLHPQLELDAMARMLRPNGLLFVLTGDAGLWTARLAGPRWEYLHCVGHVSILSRRALLEMMKPTGLGVLYHRTVNHHAGVELVPWLRELARNYLRRARGYRRYRRMHYHRDHQLVIARKHRAARGEGV